VYTNRKTNFKKSFPKKHKFIFLQILETCSLVFLFSLLKNVKNWIKGSHIKIPKAKDKQIHRVCKGEKKGKAGKPDSNL